MKTFALVGKNISYSFSKKYFVEKFSKENIQNAEYINFDIQNINELAVKIRLTPTLAGMNVTIPYKTAVMPFLDELDSIAQKIGAVNVIAKIPISKKNTPTEKVNYENFLLKGFNTDWIGFQNALVPMLKPHHNKALILGSGGASKAVAFALKKLGINHKIVSRTPNNEQVSYQNLTELIPSHFIVINTTPLGTFPNVNSCPNVPYNLFSINHIAFDLVYNPTQTLFLNKAQAAGAATQNGYKMLVEQAEEAWRIWHQYCN